MKATRRPQFGMKKKVYGSIVVIIVPQDPDGDANEAKLEDMDEEEKEQAHGAHGAVPKNCSATDVPQQVGQKASLKVTWAAKQNPTLRSFKCILS